MADFVKEKKIDWPVAVDVDEKTTAAFAVDSYPDYYVVDRAGNLRVADLANSDLERAVKILLEEKAGKPSADQSASRSAIPPIEKHPTFIAEKPLFGVFHFKAPPGAKPTKTASFSVAGKEAAAEPYVWAVLDKRKAGSKIYDILYLDRDADGDLTEAGESFSPSDTLADKTSFSIGRFEDPVTGKVHKDFSLTWHSDNRVSYRIKWRGDKIVRGCYGTGPKEYGKFSANPATAPVIVPGHDQPFEFQHWMSGVLNKGRDNDFKVFIGNRGSGRGTFSCVDDKFLPEGDYVVATLIYRDGSGERRTVKHKLKQRC